MYYYIYLSILNLNNHDFTPIPSIPVCSFSHFNFSDSEKPLPLLSISSVQSLSRVWLFATPWTAPRQASLSISNSRSLLKLLSIELVMPSNQLILCRPLLLPPSIFPRIRVFSNKSALHIRWPKYWSFSFSISPPNEYSELIFFRIDWFDLLAVQGTLKSLPQHRNLKASVLWLSASYICTWLLEKTKLWLYQPLSAKWCLWFLIPYHCIGY